MKALAFQSAMAGFMWGLFAASMISRNADQALVELLSAVALTGSVVFAYLSAKLRYEERK